jgi:DNA-binding NarL/FixJ family response regulator
MNLLLIDDQGMVREGLAMVLRATADITAVREAASMADALKAPGPFDVIVAGHIGREASTEELVRRLHETFPVAKVLVLTAVENPAEVHIAFGAGATGYVLKQASAADLIEAVTTVAAGSDYLQPELGAAMARWQHGVGPNGGLVSQLSSRQRQVLGMIALGHTNAEIATAIGVSLRTVEAHRGNILRRLGLRSRAELVKYAFEEGLVSIPQD